MLTSPQAADASATGWLLLFLLMVVISVIVFILNYGKRAPAKVGGCPWCGSSAGPFKSEHAECRELAAIVTRAVVGDGNAGDGPAFIAEHDEKVRDRLRLAAVAGVKAGAEQILADHVLTEQEEARVVAVVSALHPVGADAVAISPEIDVLAGARLLREIASGRPLEAMVGTHPFQLQKGESMLWLQHGVRYLEDRVHREREGAYGGFSFRVVSGVYYRTGRTASHTVETSSMDPIDTGTVGLTEKHLYFAGRAKAFRIAFPKIVSLVPYADGVGLYRDVANAKQQVFVTGQGWLITDLVAGLGARATAA